MGTWPELLRALTGLPLEHREVIVLTCVRGDDDGQLASNLGCDAHTATLRRQSTMEYMRGLAARALPPETLSEDEEPSSDG